MELTFLQIEINKWLVMNTNTRCELAELVFTNRQWQLIVDPDILTISLSDLTEIVNWCKSYLPLA